MADEAYLTEVAYLASSVPNLGTFAVPYPAGSSQADFGGVGSVDAHEAIVNDNDRYLALMGEVSVAFSSLAITVTNKSGVTWPALAKVALLFDLSNAYTRGEVHSVNGKSGIVTLVADDIGGLAAVAKTNSYDDLADKPTLVSMFNGRSGAVTPLQADYDDFFMTPAEVSASYLPLSGGTLTNFLSLHATPTIPAHAANKQYVDNRCMPFSGGTFTGAVTLAADPTNALNPASKQYVDNLLNGLDPKASCRVATTANITLSGTQTIDGVAVAAGERVLVKDQSTPAQNGIYVVAAGAWTRATDMDAWLEVPGANAWVEEGASNADRAYVCTSNIGGTIGTTAITWVMYFGTGAFQSASPILTSLAGAAAAADVIAYFNGATTMAVTAFTSYGRSIVGAADAAAARTVLAAEELGVTRGVVRYTANATAAIGDAGCVVLMNVASANTYTIPPNSSVAFKIGTYINLAQSNAGQTTIVAGAGVTIQNKYGLKFSGQWAGGQIVKIATDEWLVVADTTT